MKRLCIALGILIMMTNIANAAEAYFGGGCFWCMEAAYQEVPEVTDAISGYTDDDVEIVKVIYDPAKISYAKLVEIYWYNVDPFDSNGQFFDRGHKYRTAIYAANEEEKKIAEASKA
ncbi:MAG TPA: peptide-methionine (S)-S-oxide reductase, partial [Alphaproteobacteria bacterium]|nr:peptide-methionine (S)-S-oxide reductase [Alphaproteobacteria bacterium]